VQLFKSLPIAKEVFRTLPERAQSYARDTMTAGWEDRLRARGRRFTDQGLAFATALPRGTVLRAGDWLVVDEHQVAVAVVEHPEPVLIVEPHTSSEWGLFGYLIGNSHQPVMVTGTAIVCADLPGMEQVLAHHRIPFRRAISPFTPLVMNVDHLHQP
jgi:urease accessory protein UreE